MAIRVVVVDDHPLVRRGLVEILKTEDDINVVGEARDGVEAVNKTLELRPDVILMEICMPGCSGLEAMVAIKEKLPTVRVLILTMSDRQEDLLRALRLGADGYLLKSASITELVEAVRRTAGGEVTLSPSMTSRLVAEFREKANDPCLSTREVEVLQLLEQGLTDTEIAKRLFIGETTVRTYLRRLLDKLQLKNRVEAAAYAARHNLIQKRR